MPEHHCTVNTQSAGRIYKNAKKGQFRTRDLCVCVGGGQKKGEGDQAATATLTFSPGWNLVPRCRTRMLPGMTFEPGYIVHRDEYVNKCERTHKYQTKISPHRSMRKSKKVGQGGI